jgi:hypothetical protein
MKSTNTFLGATELLRGKQRFMKVAYGNCY